MGPGFMGAGPYTNEAAGAIHLGGGGGPGTVKPQFNQIFFGIRKHFRQLYPGRTGRFTPFTVKTGEQFMGGGFGRIYLPGQEPEGRNDFSPGGIRFPARVFKQGTMLKAVSATDAVGQSSLPFLKTFECFSFIFHWHALYN
jgi:hypothetical protein